MRVALTLLVRDEADIIRANIEHHRAHGVEVVIATDNGSVDGTREILAEYSETGSLRLIDEPARNYDQWRWVTRMARLAAVEYGADWILHADADEFWYADGDSIPDVLASVPDEFGWLRVKRFNFVPVTNEDGPFFERLVVRDLRSRNAFGRPLLDKICHRADEDVWLSQGNHDIHTPFRRYEGHVPLRILHFPVRSYAQLERKVVLGGRAYARNGELEPEIGDVWRQLYRRYLRGELRRWYRRQIPDAAAVARGIAGGRYVVDRSLETFCRSAGFDGDGLVAGLPYVRARRNAPDEPVASEHEPATVEVNVHSRRAGIDGRLEERLVEFIDCAEVSLACAAFDLRSTAVAAALHEAEERGVDVRVRIDPSARWPAGYGCDVKPVGASAVVRGWRLPTLTAHAGVMHHKFVVRDGSVTWTGSANFTPEGLHEEDNDGVVVHSRVVANAFLAAFAAPGRPPGPLRVPLADGELTVLFGPGETIRDGIVATLESAERIRIAAHTLEDPTLLTVLRRRRETGADVAGAYDAEGMAVLLRTSRRDPQQLWFLLDGRFAAARDRLHNRLIVADDTVITGSANLTAAAATQAENAVVIRSPSVASVYREYIAALLGASRQADT